MLISNLPSSILVLIGMIKSSLTKYCPVGFIILIFVLFKSFWDWILPSLTFIFVKFTYMLFSDLTLSTLILPLERVLL